MQSTAKQKYMTALPLAIWALPSSPWEFAFWGGIINKKKAPQMDPLTPPASAFVASGDNKISLLPSISIVHSLDANNINTIIITGALALLAVKLISILFAKLVG